MQVVFSINKEPKIKLNKNFTPIKSKNCTIKDSLDIESPVLRVAYDAELITYNYVYIPELSRYYYYSKPPIIENHEMYIYLSEDYLMSHKTDILNSYGHITRSKAGSNWVKDPMAISKDKPIYQVTSLGTCFTPSANYIMIKGGN